MSGRYEEKHGIRPPPIILGLCLLVTSAWTTPPSLALFLISAVVAGAGVGAMIRGCLTIVISAARPDDRAGAVATLFTAGYTGVSIPVIGVGVVLQYVSPRLTLLIFALAVIVWILAVAPILVRPPAEPARARKRDPGSMTALCRCFGAEIAAARIQAPRAGQAGPPVSATLRKSRSSRRASDG